MTVDDCSGPRENPNDQWCVRLLGGVLFVNHETAEMVAQAIEHSTEKTLAVTLVNGFQTVIVLSHVTYIRDYSRAARRIDNRMNVIEDHETTDDTKDLERDDDEPWKAAR